MLWYEAFNRDKRSEDMVKYSDMSDMEFNMKRIKRTDAGNWFIIAGILIITNLEWHFFDWYQASTRYGTLITFVALAGAFFCYVDIKDAIRDKLFWIMVVTDLIALINLFILGSGKGCILVVADMMLIFYLSDKIRFTKRQSYFILAYVAFFFFYWTIDVKGYFKGYNTNYGGLILITGFSFLMVLMQVFNDKLQYKLGEFVGEYGKTLGMKSWYKRFWWYPILYLAFIVIAFKIISWYRSRTALMGLIALFFIMIFPRKIVANRIVYPIICVLVTAGSVAFTGIYILLGRAGDGEGLQLFYKSIISGRNDIWGEFWQAYIKQPITGFGSSYIPKLEFMGGILEVHNAMLDILFVHGAIVFIALCGTFIFKLLKLRSQTEANNLGKVIFSAIVCMLVTGFFENYYIIQPFSLMLLSLFALNPDDIKSLADSKTTK